MSSELRRRKHTEEKTSTATTATMEHKSRSVHVPPSHREEILEVIEDEMEEMPLTNRTKTKRKNNSYRYGHEISKDDKNNNGNDSLWNHQTSTADGYTLIPLRQRSILLRLDVGPFFVLYSILIGLDFIDHLIIPSEYQTAVQWTSQVVFPLVLLLHVILFLLQQWDVYWRAWVGYRRMNIRTKSNQEDTFQGTQQQINATIMSRWTHCLVEAPHVDKHHSSHDAGIVAIQHTRNNLTTLKTDHSSTTDAAAAAASTVAMVNFQDVIFRCCASSEANDADALLWSVSSSGQKTDEMKKVESDDSMEQPLSFHRLRYPIHLPLSFYINWRGYTSPSNVVQGQHVYGTNTTHIELPPFLELLQEQVVAPFFLFQVLCVLLWSLDEYWYYALFTFFALLLFESTVAYNRLQSLQRLRSHTASDQRPIWAYRPAYPPGRNGWIQIFLAELLPGDIVSCKQLSPAGSSRKSIGTRQQQQNRLNRVPADILILRGDAVVDEALLTGESVPQLKLAVEASSSSSSSSPSSQQSGEKPDGNNTNEFQSVSEEERLDLQEHKSNILFGGTTLLVTNPGTDDYKSNGNGNDSAIPPPPDFGVVGMVLRTGFETAQGSLLRTMAHTQKSVDGIHTRDTYVFILLLLCCAVASASLVWTEGWSDPARNKFRLVLHVIIIITSVVPPELPMELSLAVTNSVADLMKRCQVYCTEVFRIPLAGQVNMCCFDKTGTLTSDEMQLRGIRCVVDNDDTSSTRKIVFSNKVLSADNVPWETERIMVACHSLALNGRALGRTMMDRNNKNAKVANVIGDPLEKAVLKETSYRLIQNNALRIMDDDDDNSEDDPAGSSTTKAATMKIKRPKTILILQRFGFSSRLKRMTVVAVEENNTTTWTLTKGAPETMKRFFRTSSIPANYDEIYMSHMAQGQRVLAMGYRAVAPHEKMSNNNNSSMSSSPSPSSSSKFAMSRETLESDLIFAGFLLLHCPIKPDSAPVIQELRSSGHGVVMITGDAVLTAAEVARQVGIILPRKKQIVDKNNTIDSRFPITYQLERKGNKERASLGNINDPLEGFQFVPLLAEGNGTTSDSKRIIPLCREELKYLKKQVEMGEIALCVSGDMLQQLVILASSLGDKHDDTELDDDDGDDDYHNHDGEEEEYDDDDEPSQTTPLQSQRPRSKATKKQKKKDEKQILFHPRSQSILKDLVPLISVFARHAPRQKEAIIASFNLGGYNTLMCGDGTNDVGALRRAHVGISLISAPEVEAKQRSATEAIKAQQKKQRKERKKKGGGMTPSSSTTTRNRKKGSSSLEESLRQLQEAQAELDHVELGDASIASPFTSRTVSIKCCKDVLQQGRCTLVTMLQIYKILGINCLVNAMVLSKLFLHGVKQGDRQLTILGVVVAALFFFVTRGKPLATLSPNRPPSSVLCIQALLSISIQFGIHFGAILLATEVSLSFVDPYDPSMIPDGPFNPNTLNTCTFLLSVLATVNTFAVNYRGEPFMEPLRKNIVLVRSLQLCYAVLLICALEIFPPLNDLLQLAPFPDANEQAEWTVRADGTDTPRLLTRTKQSNNDEDDGDIIAIGRILFENVMIGTNHWYNEPNQENFFFIFQIIVQVIGLPTFMCCLMIFDTAMTFSIESLLIRIFG